MLDFYMIFSVVLLQLVPLILALVIIVEYYFNNKNEEKVAKKILDYINERFYYSEYGTYSNMTSIEVLKLVNMLKEGDKK